VESWEVNDDGSEWTFHLRKGTKWSDGTEHTTKDVQWWYDNEVLNETIFPGLTEGRWFTGTGETKKMMDLVITDDYTFTFKYAEPKPLLIYTMGRQGVAAPAHYMKQWDPETG
jgi:peptide/nickel transport system substrate-binding protein